MTVTGVECRECGEAIWSRHRYDFVSCKCGETFVDGGRDSFRYGAEESVPRVVKLDVEDE